MRAWLPWARWNRRKRTRSNGLSGTWRQPRVLCSSVNREELANQKRQLFCKHSCQALFCRRQRPSINWECELQLRDCLCQKLGKSSNVLRTKHQPTSEGRLRRLNTPVSAKNVGPSLPRSPQLQTSRWSSCMLARDNETELSLQTQPKSWISQTSLRTNSVTSSRPLGLLSLKSRCFPNPKMSPKPVK